MSDGVGLSVGATNLAAVVVGRTAVTRSPVVTLYPHRPPEVGVPSENANLTERGLIITDFTDRVGDPVGIVATRSSIHTRPKPPRPSRNPATASSITACGIGALRTTGSDGSDRTNSRSWGTSSR